MATREGRLSSKGTGRTFSSSPQPPNRIGRRSASEARAKSAIDGDNRIERAPMAPPPPPPPHTSSTSAIILSEDVKQSQMFCFSRFINGRLGGGKGMTVKSLTFANDLADGIIYARLISLSKDIGDLDPNSENVNALKHETSLSRRKDNLMKVMELLRSSNLLPPSCAKPSEANKIIVEIVSSNISVTLDFTFHLLLKLQMYRLKNVIHQAPHNDPCFTCLQSLISSESVVGGGRSSSTSGTSGLRYLNSLSDMQRLLLNWCSDLVKSKGLQVWNFNASIQDGKVLLAMVHALLPEVFPFDPVLTNTGVRGAKFTELKALNLATALGRLESPPLCVVNCVSFSRDTDALEERSVVLLLSEFLIKACIVARRRFDASLKIQKAMKMFHHTHPPRQHKAKHRHHHHSPKKEKKLGGRFIGENSFVRNRRVGSDTAGSDEAWLDAAEGDMTLLAINQSHSVDPHQQLFREDHQNHSGKLPTDALEKSHDDNDDGGGVDGTLAAVTLQHEATLSQAVPINNMIKPSKSNKTKIIQNDDMSKGKPPETRLDKYTSQGNSSQEQGSRFEAEKQQWLSSLESSFLKSDKHKTGMLESSTVFDGLRESTPGASKSDLMDLINDWKLPDGRVMYMNMITSLKSHTPTGAPTSHKDGSNSSESEFELGAGVSVGLSDDRKSEGDIVDEPSPGGVSDQIRRHRERRGIITSSPKSKEKDNKEQVYKDSKEQLHKDSKEQLHKENKEHKDSKEGAFRRDQIPPVPPRQHSSPNVIDKLDKEGKDEEIVIGFSRPKSVRRGGSASGKSESKIPIQVIRPREGSSQPIREGGSQPMNAKMMSELEALRSESLNYGLLQEAATSLQTAHELLLDEHKVKMEELALISLERDQLASKLLISSRDQPMQVPSISSKASANPSKLSHEHKTSIEDHPQSNTTNDNNSGQASARLLKVEQELSESKMRERKLQSELDLIKTTEKLNKKPNSDVLGGNVDAGFFNNNSPVSMSTAQVKSWLEKYVFSGTGRISSVCLDLDGRSLHFLASASSQGTPWEFLRYVQESFAMTPPIALRFAHELDILFPTQQSGSGGSMPTTSQATGGPESPLKRYGFPSRGRSRSKDKDYSKDLREERGDSLGRQPPLTAPPNIGSVSDNQFLKKDMELKNKETTPKKVPSSPKTGSPSAASRMLFRLVDR